MDRRRINNLFLKSAAVLAVGSLSLAAHAQSAVGRITASLKAQVRTGMKPFANALPNQSVFNGDGIRTPRRGYAEITFKDGSIIRVNERTDMIIQDAAQLRRIQLDAGMLWVKDTRGSNTRVQTPVGTATARGTVFTVTSDLWVDVFDGYVDIVSKGVTISLGPGESGAIGPNGTPMKFGTFKSANLPLDQNGEALGWWMLDNRAPVPPTALLGSLVSPFAAMSQLGKSALKPELSVVPEPATVMALGIGVVAILRRTLKR